MSCWVFTSSDRSSAAPLPPFDAWIRIHPGGRVVLTGRQVEMGQGIHTALAQILAQELDVDWADVAVEQAPVDPSRYDHLTVQRQRPLVVVAAQASRCARAQAVGERRSLPLAGSRSRLPHRAG